MGVPRRDMCRPDSNKRAWLSTSKANRVLDKLRSDNADLEREKEEAATELAKIKELINKVELAVYAKVAVLSYLKFKSTPR